MIVEDQQLYDTGVQAALRYAANLTYDERARIASALEEILDDGDVENTVFAPAETDSYSPGERVYAYLYGSGDPRDFDRGESPDFWLAQCQQDEPDLDWLYGFSCGLLV